MAGKINKNNNFKKCRHHRCHQEPAAAPRGARGKGPGGAGTTAPSPAGAARELLCVVPTGRVTWGSALTSLFWVLFFMELKQKAAPASFCCSETPSQSNPQPGISRVPQGLGCGWKRRAGCCSLPTTSGGAACSIPPCSYSCRGSKTALRENHGSVLRFTYLAVLSAPSKSPALLLPLQQAACQQPSRGTEGQGQAAGALLGPCLPGLGREGTRTRLRGSSAPWFVPQIAAGHPGAPGIKLLGVAAAFVISWPRGAGLQSQGVKVTSGSSPAWRHPKLL